MEAFSMYESHAHTRRFSPDATQTLDELIGAAKAAGLAGVTATEHMDPDLDQGLMVFDVDAYFSAMEDARACLPPGLRLLNGIELGYLPHLVARYESMVRERPFDLVIGSVHAIDGDDIYFRRGVFGRGRDFAYGAYLDLIIDMVRSGDWFDVVGHYDYVTRVSGYPSPRFLYREQPERFDTLFRCMIGGGKSLEINARTVRYLERIGEKDTMPDPGIFQRYRDLGGEHVTLGSDAHAPDEVGQDFDRMRSYLKALGFDRATVFESRKPVSVFL
jgi:histidinol-phosphatase (PHP family)